MLIILNPLRPRGGDLNKLRKVTLSILDSAKEDWEIYLLYRRGGANA